MSCILKLIFPRKSVEGLFVIRVYASANRDQMKMALSVSFDSLRSRLRSCLRQSISLWSVVVNFAEFGVYPVNGSSCALGSPSFPPARGTTIGW